MGLYDRDYIRQGPQLRFENPLGPQWQTSAVFWIIAITVGVFFLQLILKDIGVDPVTGNGLDYVLYCQPARVVEGLEVWRLLTAAFCHETSGIMHLFWNMIILFMLAPMVERLYGRRDFVAFYLTAAVIGNLVYCLLPYVAGTSPFSWVLGASGACMAVLVLCALYYPQRTVIFFIFPVPLWLIATFLVFIDLFDFLHAQPGDRVAHVVHLAGAGVGALYRYVDLRLTTLFAWVGESKFRRQLRRVRERPEPGAPRDGVPRFIEDVENQRLDRILQKISQFGRESLTEEEIEFLNRMSRRYRGNR
jgi:membrane associated rhomboid family serine protease